MEKLTTYMHGRQEVLSPIVILTKNMSASDFFEATGGSLDMVYFIWYAYTVLCPLSSQ